MAEDLGKETVMGKKPLYNWISDAVCMVAIIATFVITIVRWPSIPDKIPTHYDFAGNITGYGGKGTIWVLPAMALFLFILITVIEFFPQSWNTGVRVTRRNAAKVYAYTRMLVVVTKVLTVFFMCGIGLFFCYGKSIPSWLIIFYVVLLTASIIFFLVKSAAASKR